MLNTPDETHKHEGLIVATLTVLSCAFLATGVGRFTGLCDEGILTSIADRVAQGETLYGQVNCYFGPTTVYLYAAAFKLLGTSVAISQWLLLVNRLLCVLAVYALSRAMASPGAAAASAVIFLFGCCSEPHNFSYHWSANLPLLATLLCAQRYLASGGAIWAGLLGAATALTGMTLQTFLPAAAWAALLTLLGRRKPRDAAACAVGFSLISLGFVALFWTQGTLHGAYYDLVRANLIRTNFDWVSWGQALSSLTLSWDHLIWIGVVVLGLVEPLVQPRQRWRSFDGVLYLTQWVLYLAFAYRPVASQFMLHGMLAYPFLARALDRPTLPARGLLAVLGTASFVLGWRSLAANLSARIPVQFPRGTVFVSSRQEAESLVQLIRFLQRRASAREKILITPYAPNVYFLMDFGNATRYTMLRPVHYSHEVLQSSLEQVRKAKVFHFTAYDTPQFLLPNWPNVPLAEYQREQQWFHQELLKDHDYLNAGALLYYSPKATTKDAPKPSATTSSLPGTDSTPLGK